MKAAVLLGLLGPFLTVLAGATFVAHFCSLVDANSWAPPFHSVDPQPVQVTLRTDGTPGSITFEVPRAWIVFSLDQRTKVFDEVPDRITTTDVHLELADPDATGLSIRKNQLAGEDSMAIRRAEYILELWRPDPNVSMEQWARAQGPRHIVKRDGLEYDTSRGGQFLLHPVPGEIAEARCNGWVPEGGGGFCDYYVRLGPELYATLIFLDFRKNGGPAIAARRMRDIVARFCRQPGVVCSPNWTRQAAGKK